MKNADLENFLPTASGIEPEPNWTFFEAPDFPEMPEDENWLEDALPLAVFTSVCPKIRALVNDLFYEVSSTLPVQNEHRIKESIKTVVLNLWRARLMDMPVRYSRKKAYYTRHRRYGRLHFKFRRLIKVIDRLDALGYLEQKQGFFARAKDLGRQTRMWGTDRLWTLFEHHQVKGTNFIQVPEPEELIELRAGKNSTGERDYIETAETISMRDDLNHYNEFVRRHAITVHLDGEVEVSNRFLLGYLQPNLLNNTITLEVVVPITSISKENITLNNTSNYYNTSTLLSNTLSQYIFFYSMTGTEGDELSPLQVADIHSEWLFRRIGRLRKQLRKIRDKQDRKSFLEKRHCLNELGVEFLMFRLVKESLHRVFNRGSFDCNGRAYGALHQKLPKELRPFIHIDGRPTLEIDFRAYHVIMLYHLKGIDYPEDPYTVCGGLEMRKAFKIASLIGINAPTIRKAYRAILAKFEEENIPLPMVKRPLKYLIETYKARHQPIADSICSDVGIELQNIDSHIMNSILMRLMDMGILGLSVYDSVIVAEEFAEIARSVMIEEYQKVFGFKPRV
jgi:hypothetical protein